MRGVGRSFRTRIRFYFKHQKAENEETIRLLFSFLWCCFCPTLSLNPTSNQRQLQLQPKRRPPALGSLAVPRWTPPLSPSRSRSSTKYKENRQCLQSPQDALLVLRSPGVPALSDLVEIKELVGAASRPWLRDFLIRGGRCVSGRGIVGGPLYSCWNFETAHVMRVRNYPVYQVQQVGTCKVVKNRRSFRREESTEIPRSDVCCRFLRKSCWFLVNRSPAVNYVHHRTLPS